MEIDTPNFKKISAAFEKHWGYPLICGNTHMGDKVVSAFVTFDTVDVHTCTGYGDTIAEAIENLHTNIYERLKNLCNVAQ